jgi:hypothetical protein
MASISDMAVAAKVSAAAAAYAFRPLPYILDLSYINVTNLEV